ncbi:MAG: oligopeptidase A [Succinatimonas sp.]|jgi:oligopeptidase A|nr:oligopeptidase A [Succinatimonas sp.]MDD5868859.1 oligopeptidase A [Succinatimonas sp.]MDY5721012.1 oligopeptidase A [Succinivibrio sp.]
MSDLNNPLLNYSGLPPFSSVKPECIKEAVVSAIEKCKKTIIDVSEKFKAEPTWDNVVAPVEESDDLLSKVWSVVSHLNSVNNTPDLRAVHDECLPILSEFSTWAGQYKPYFEVLKKIESSDAFSLLSKPQQKAIKNSIRDFKLSGIDLNEADQKTYAQIESKLSELTSRFSNNVLDATHGYTLHVTELEKLKGLPEGALKLAKNEAENRKLDGYVFTLEMPSYLPFLTYCENRELRHEIYVAYNTRSSEIGPNAGKWDNAPIMEEILKLRHELAKLLGFKSYAHLSLATKMADAPETVVEFLKDLAHKSHKQGLKEVEDLRQYAKSQGLDELQPWDMAFYSEKLRQEKYSYSEEELRPYFPENVVIKGMFECAHRLYGISLKERLGVDVWNDAVKCFDVYEDKFGSRIGSLFMDLYARPGKNGGAWMDECLTRRYRADGALQLPVAYLICNFTRPVNGKYSELTHDEVVTMFHEFGHTLNQLLTKIDISDVSGINGVPWDAVELPSQFNENFAWQEEVLKFLSSHVKTHEPLPKEKLDAVLKAKNFESAMAMLRQIEFALFDFRIHLEYDPSLGGRIFEILNEVKKEVAVVPNFKDSRFPNNFTHIFSGGYAAGYYSYKWAEVLAADAFSLFEEKGIFNKSVGKSFEELILACGGASDPMKNFEDFRGRKPSVDALLKQSGIEA